jgi:hypothetical protein
LRISHGLKQRIATPANKPARRRISFGATFAAKPVAASQARIGMNSSSAAVYLTPIAKPHAMAARITQPRGPGRVSFRRQLHTSPQSASVP